MRNNKTTKGNKRPIKKLIALWVVFAMLVVPFASYVGDKEGAKAASDVQVIADAQTYTEMVNLTIAADGGSPAIQDGHVDITLLKSAQKFQFKFESLTDPNNISPLTIGYIENSSLDDPEEVLDASTNCTEIHVDDTITVSDTTSDKTIAIYAYGDEAPKRLQYVIKVNRVDAFTTNDGIYPAADSTGPFDDGTYTASAYLKAGSTDVASVATASLKYYVGTTDLTDEQKKAVATYAATSNTISKDDTAIGNKIIYAAVISDNNTPGDPADDVVLAYEKLGSVYICNDEVAPYIGMVSEVEVWNSATSSFTLDSDREYHTVDNIYYGASDKYRLDLNLYEDSTNHGAMDISGVEFSSIKVELYDMDDTLAETLDKVDTTLENTPNGKFVYSMDEGKLRIILTSAQVEDGVKIKVYAEDKMGNPATFEYHTAIKQVVPVTTIESVKFDGQEWEDRSTQKKVFGMTDTKKSLIVTLKSTYVIDKVTLQNDWEGVNITSQPQAPDRTYTTEWKFEVPKGADYDFSNSQTLTGLNIQAYNGINQLLTGTTSLADIIYDAEAPSITNITLQKRKNSSEAWQTVTSDSSVTTVTDVNEDGTLYEYRYTMTVVDVGGSGLKQVKVGNAVAELASGDVYAYIIPVNDLMPGASFNEIISAVDYAGNQTQVTQYPKVVRINDSLRYESVSVVDENGTPVPNQDLSLTTNKKHKLSVTVSSAYPITELTLYGADPSPQTKTFTVAENGEKTSENRYVVSHLFTLPKEANNADMKNMYLVVKDGRVADLSVRYPDDTTKYIGDILYDRTQPVFTLHSELRSDIWYPEYNLSCTIASGDGSQTVESNLAFATYTLGNCVGVTGEAISLSPQVAVAQRTISIPQSVSPSGTTIAFAAQDLCENTLPATNYTIKVDGEAPKITKFDVNGKTIISNALEGDVVIHANVSDNLTIASATIQVVGPDTNVTKSLCEAGESVNIGKDNSFTLNELIGKQAVDGDYTVTVKVSDKAGNAAADRTISFTVDNTIPVVTAKIAGGTTAGKQPGTNFDGTTCDYYYSSNVSVLLTYEDNNLAASGVTVTDNGNPLSLVWEKVGTSSKYQATYTATQEGAHTIQIDATDDAGNAAVTKQVVFIRDTTLPTVSAVINGGIIYTEGMGTVDLTTNATVNFSVSDANEDVADFNYQMIKTVPDTLPVTADYIKTGNRVFGYVDEADYEVNVYAVDKAGNIGPARNVKFRVDKAAPELKISGTGSGSSLNAGTTLTFTMTEAFWKDASGKITITRKAGDGAAEATYKTIDFKPTARTTNMSESLTETGEYKITFTAKDRAGHTSETPVYTVRIDKDKPVITLNGVANNDKTTGEVTFMAQISDDFYLTKAISIKATRTYLDETTNKEKTEDIKFTGYNAAASDTIIRDTFMDDGIYKIQITCKDAAGNEDVQEVSFTIDKSKPVIDQKVLESYKGTLTAFTWDYDINDFVYDLTVCDVHMYLNGSEYDGTSEIEDGVYEMKITAEDELGNYEEQIVNFTLDTKAPTFIVTGVEDGEVKNEQYSIEVSLQLDEDVLDSVALNGSAIEVKDNKASLTVSAKGDYELTMKAHDAAGNEAEKTVRFTYGEKSKWWIFLIAGIAGVAVIGGAIFVIARKRK